MTHLRFICVNQDWKTAHHTSVWTQVQVTGAILDAKTVAVFAPVLRNWVVALSLCQLNSSAAGSRTISKGAPLAPPSVNLRQDNIVSLVVNRPEVTVKWDIVVPPPLPWGGRCCSCRRTLLGSTLCQCRNQCRPPRGSVGSGRPAVRGPSRCTTAWSRAACRGKAWSRGQTPARTDGAGCSWNQAGCQTETAASEADPVDSLLHRQCQKSQCNVTCVCLHQYPCF